MTPTDPPWLDWHPGDVPVSRRYDDPYFAPADGLGEAEHVFLRGNRLARRWAGARNFRTAELGFGTGLNFLAALALWRGRAAEGARLEHTAFEIAPLPRDAMARALARFPAIRAEAEALLERWPDAAPPGDLALELPGARLRLLVGDARARLPGWEGRADAWMLDGFAPARNPEMWEPPLLAAVHAHTVPGGTAATYSAAGPVRRGLAAAGFAVLRAPGFGAKRHMTRAVRPV